MKKNLLNIAISAVLLLSSVSAAFAEITSSEDISDKISRLEQLSSFDYLNLVNKSELIGQRLSNFELQSSQYKNEVFLIKDSLEKILDQIKLIDEKKDMPENEKKVQIQKLYRDADSLLYNLDSKTVQYIYNVRMSMPSLTYQRYTVSFREFYNSLDISNNKISQ